MERNNQRKNGWQKWVSRIACFVLGGACGALIAQRMISVFALEKMPGGILLEWGFLVVVTTAAIFLQLIVHEAGHLLFGLLTGYRYSSFRIGGFMWLKENEKIRLRKLSVAGTGGQCLMCPPELVDGTMPFKLYNLGGVLANGISGVLFWGLSMLCGGIPLLSAFLFTAALSGFALALANGVPMRLGTLDNDGYNTLSMGKNSEALRAFWLQMKVNERLAQGARLRDMPEAWFAVPSPEGMQNSMCAVVGVFACNRLIDLHAFREADRLMEELLQMDTAIVGLHRGLLLCDRMYCELIAENRLEKLEGMLDQRQRKFMHSMQKFPSVLRTEYAYALLAERDMEKARRIRERFDVYTRTYPYPSEVEGECELLRIAQERAGSKRDGALTGANA